MAFYSKKPVKKCFMEAFSDPEKRGETLSDKRGSKQEKGERDECSVTRILIPQRNFV